MLRLGQSQILKLFFPSLFWVAAFYSLECIAAPRDGKCVTLMDKVVENGLITDFEKNLYSEALATPEGKAAWQKYLDSVQKVPPRKPLGNGIFKQQDGSPVSDKIQRWARDLNDFMGDRDSWVKWNIAFAERIRARAKNKGESLYDSMLAELILESNARGFGADIIVLKKNTDFEWRKMLSEGKIFVDTIVGRGNDFNHTEIIHALQLLYVQSRLELRGYPKGEMSTIMKEFLGNTRLIDSIDLIDPATGLRKDDYQAPWRELFDASVLFPMQAQMPEWFGILWHQVANDIPYGEILQRVPGNYPP